MRGERSNKGMKLTKLSAAPTLAPQAALGRRCRRMPAPVNGLDAGTASQLIPGVRPTWRSGMRTLLCSLVAGVLFCGVASGDGFKMKDGRYASGPVTVLRLSPEQVLTVKTKRIVILT